MLLADKTPLTLMHEFQTVENVLPGILRVNHVFQFKLTCASVSHYNDGRSGEG